MKKSIIWGGLIFIVASVLILMTKDVPTGSIDIPLFQPQPLTEPPSMPHNLSQNLIRLDRNLNVPIIKNSEIVIPSRDGDGALVDEDFVHHAVMDAAKVISQNIPDFKGVISSKHAPGSEKSFHKAGRAFDFQVVDETEFAYERAYSNVVEILSRAGLDYSEYTLINHMKHPDDRMVPHLHLQFNNDAALEKLKKMEVSFVEFEIQQLKNRLDSLEKKLKRCTKNC